MAKNCGCKPCSKPLPEKGKRKCKPFSLCVGNYTLSYDGECPVLEERKYKIPNGTYSSITFEDGCIVGVGECPAPVYTPMQCCDNERPTAPIVSPVTPTVGNQSFVWDNTGVVSVTGDGSANRPWKPKVKIAKGNNQLKDTPSGLKVDFAVKGSDTVKITGTGTTEDPYVFTSVGADAKLPKVNKTEVEGDGYTIDEFGRMVNIDEGTKFVTNLSFDNPAFTVVNAGVGTKVVVDEAKLKTGMSLATADGVVGKGTSEEPLKLDLTPDVVAKMLTVIEGNATLKQRLKTILGV